MNTSPDDPSPMPERAISPRRSPGSTRPHCLPLRLGFAFKSSAGGLMTQMLPSAASAFDFRVERFQLRSRVVDAKLPVDVTLLVVGVLVPGCGFLAQLADGREAAT